MIWVFRFPPVQKGGSVLEGEAWMPDPSAGTAEALQGVSKHIPSNTN
jgi:hypothetical protein